MPKIIEGLRENILEESRGMLLESGYEALTVRAVAQRCGVAVGTVYNYFSSKDMLIASVMLADWQRALMGMQAETSRAKALETGLRAMFDGLYSFGATYRSAWGQYTAMGGSMVAMRERHQMLIGQLVAVMRPMLTGLALCTDEMCMEIAANTLLSYAMEEGRGFDSIAHALRRLLNEPVNPE